MNIKSVIEWHCCFGCKLDDLFDWSGDPWFIFAGQASFLAVV